MSTNLPDVISRYFERDADRDIDSIVSLFADDATVIDEGEERHGTAEIRAWQTGAASEYTYTTEITGTEALGYWFPADGRGTIGSDMIAIPKNAKNPVLAHHFLNFILDNENGYSNFANYVGYQPPLISLDPDKLVSDGVVPKNLKTAIVRESDFDTGLPLTELTPTGQADWQNAWAEFKAGV